MKMVGKMVWQRGLLGYIKGQKCCMAMAFVMSTNIIDELMIK